MASVAERKLKDGTSVWMAQIRVSGQATINKTFKSLSVAEEFANKTEALLLESLRNPKGALAKKSFYKEKFKHSIALFLANEERAGHHKFTLKQVLKHFDDCALGDIRPSTVEAYANKMLTLKTRMGRLFKPNTIATHLSSMAAVYRWRAKEYDIEATTTVFSCSVLPKGWDTKRDRRLSVVEERDLFSDLRRHGPKYYRWRLLIKLALETGARQQELFLADWSEFNLATRCWSMPAAHTKCKVARSVPLSKRAMRVLRALKMLSAPEEVRPFESLVSLPNIRSWFRQISARAGLVGFRFHDLRHEAVSRMVLLKRKLSVFEIMKIVGHSSTQMLDRYANLLGEELVDRFE